MKHYPRKLNRFFLTVLGLVLTAVGGFVLAAAISPQVQQLWETQGTWLQTQWARISRSAVVIGTDVSWLTVAVLAVGILAIILLLSLLLAQGGGRTKNLDDPHADEYGNTVAEVGFINDLLSTHASDSPWVHSLSTRSFEHRGQPQLSISVATFKGAPPEEMAQLVRKMVSDLDNILGRQIPVHVHVGSNWQTAIANRKRVK
ncbi:MAG: hypothetical protein Q4P06_05995 [Actinomycetaceae bacterium]|nr:hypothetical protein [Actinomycetaceae bacterium]